MGRDESCFPRANKKGCDMGILLEYICNTHIYICIHVFISIHIYVCIYIYIHMYVCQLIYIYKYTHTHPTLFEIWVPESAIPQNPAVHHNFRP